MTPQESAGKEELSAGNSGTQFHIHPQVKRQLESNQ
jgi:hypothetical protein